MIRKGGRRGFGRWQLPRLPFPYDIVHPVVENVRPIDDHVENDLQKDVFSLLKPWMEGWARSKEILNLKNVRDLNTVHPIYTYPKHVGSRQVIVAFTGQLDVAQ